MSKEKSGTQQVLDIVVASTKSTLDGLEDDFKRHITNHQTNEIAQEGLEMLRRLIDTPCFSSALGALNKDGYYETIDYGIAEPLHFLSFLSFFHGHEILDDGDPCIAWHVYPKRTEEAVDSYRPMKTVPKGTKGAEPFIARYREGHPGSEWVDCKRVVEVLDELEEKKRINRALYVKHFGERDSSKEDPKDVAGRAACHAFLDQVVEELSKELKQKEK